MLKLIIVSIILLSIAICAIAIKLFLKKDGRFSGTCAGNSEFARKEGVVCSVCGAKPEEECKKTV